MKSLRVVGGVGPPRRARRAGCRPSVKSTASPGRNLGSGTCSDRGFKLARGRLAGHALSGFDSSGVTLGRRLCPVVIKFQRAWRVTRHAVTLPDGLLDHAEDRVVLVVLGPDADGVARLEERRDRLAAVDRLDRADFGEARIADAALGDRLARAAVGVAVATRCPSRRSSPRRACASWRRARPACRSRRSCPRPPRRGRTAGR